MAIQIEYPQSILKAKLFSSLKDADMNLFIRDATMKNYRSGEYVLKEGEEGDSFYWISSGRVEIQMSAGSPSAHPMVLSMLGAGDVLGEMVLLGFTKRAASAVIRSDAQIYSWNVKKCQDLFIDHPVIGYRLLRNLGHMLGERLIATNKVLKGRTELLDSSLVKNLV